ncbi:hypothetical protein PMAYCL1PPCAC_11036, partial [Pristionchus mayeri]
ARRSDLPMRGRILSSGSTGSGELRLDRLLPDFSFLRICLDHVTLAHDSPYLANLQQKGSIFGYTLKYSFPCPDGVSSSLKAKVILRASSFSSNAIFFRHKRVNLVKLNSDVIPFWSDADLVLDLEVQLNAQGKYSTRPLARCVVPLADLLLPPFAISRDYEFAGAHFAGSALVKIHLGSKQPTLMARLERWRGETEGRGAASGSADATFTVPPARHTRSRSGSRCRSHSSDGQDNSRGGGVNEATESDEDDDDVFYDPPQPTRRGVSPFRERNSSLPSLGSRRASETAAYARPPEATRSSSTSSAPRASPLTRHLRIRLVVHAATGLPMARDHRGLLVAPSALISVRGRDGELRSPVQPQSRSPHFEWSCTFDVSGERRNVVVKVLHQDAEGNDVPLGFVSLQLPTATVREADYELIELDGGRGSSGVASTLKLSVESCASARLPSKLDDNFGAPVPVAPAPHSSLDELAAAAAAGSDIFGSSGGARTNSRLSAASSMTLPGATVPYRRRTRSPEILILDSKEEIESRLRRNMTELDIMMSRLARR